MLIFSRRFRVLTGFILGFVLSRNFFLLTGKQAGGLSYFLFGTSHISTTAEAVSAL
jgi:hypothetical protein